MKKMKQVLGVIIFLGFLVTLSTPVFAGSANTCSSEDTVAFALGNYTWGQEEGLTPSQFLVSVVPGYGGGGPGIPWFNSFAPGRQP